MSDEANRTSMLEALHFDCLCLLGEVHQMLKAKSRRSDYMRLASIEIYIVRMKDTFDTATKEKTL